VLEVGSAFRVPTFRNYTLVNPQVGSPRDLGVLYISYSPLDFEFLQCHIVNEVPGVFVRYNNLDKAWLEFQKLWYKGISKNL
jgi:hypothetical protein